MIRIGCSVETVVEPTRLDQYSCMTLTVRSSSSRWMRSSFAALLWRNTPGFAYKDSTSLGSAPGNLTQAGATADGNEGAGPTKPLKRIS